MTAVALIQSALLIFTVIGFTVCASFAIAPCILSARISRQEEPRQ